MPDDQYEYIFSPSASYPVLYVYIRISFNFYHLLVTSAQAPITAVHPDLQANAKKNYVVSILPKHIYWQEIKINCKTNNMSNWAQKQEGRLCISSVLWLIPNIGFFDGVDRLMDERTRSDINQLLMQVNYNFQVLWRLVD